MVAVGFNPGSRSSVLAPPAPSPTPQAQMFTPPASMEYRPAQLSDYAPPVTVRGAEPVPSSTLGEYDFSDENLQDTFGIKPPKLEDQRDTFWEVRKWQNSKAGTVLDKILFRIRYLCWNLTTCGLRSDTPTIGGSQNTSLRSAISGELKTDLISGKVRSDIESNAN
jgi:hypothetical protein